MTPRQLGPTELKRLHRSWTRRTKQRLALMLDGVQSPFNVGAIVRTAAALGIDHLYLAGSTASPSHVKAGKTALGTERYLSWTTFSSGSAAVDVNERALQLVRENAAALDLRNIRPARPDEVPDAVRFAGLWSNPPIRIGKEGLHHLLSGWLGRLSPDGQGWLVVHKHLGSDSLGAWLAETGVVVHRRASRQGYRILEVRWP